MLVPPQPKQQAFRLVILRLISGLSSIGFLVAASIGTFEPSWARWMAGILGAVSVVFTVLAPQEGRGRNTIVRSYLVLLLAGVFSIAITIQPFALGTLSGFVFLGIAVGIASYKEEVPAAILAGLAMLLGVVAIVLRSSQPWSASLIFFIVGAVSLTAVFGFRRVAAEATAAAIAESYRDPLTSVTNRRGLQLGTDLLFALAKRSGQRMGCLIIDIDHFKAVNDTNGHQVGDEILVDFADAISRSSRAGDLLVRVGGDEFALFTVVPGAAELSVVAERIRAAVERLDVTPRITASVGGVVPAEGLEMDLDDLLRKTDAQLYWAKKSGRNTVSVA